MNVPMPKTSPVLAAVGALCTSGAAMLAGVTTTGMLVRVAIAVAGFWAMGLVLDRILGWAVGGGAVLGPTNPGNAAAEGAKGQYLDVRLPAIAPGPGKRT